VRYARHRQREPNWMPGSTFPAPASAHRSDRPQRPNGGSVYDRPARNQSFGSMIPQVMHSEILGRSGSAATMLSGSFA
jgi:hypothetical protein